MKQGSTLTLDNVACDVEVLWPDPAQKKHDAEAELISHCKMI